MFSSKSVNRLTCIYCLTFVAAVGCLETQTPDEVSVRLMENLVRSSSLKTFSDVQVMANGNRQMTLTNLLGAEPDRWRVDPANFETVSAVVMKVLLCAYSKKMHDFVEGGKLLIEKCADLGKEDNETFKTSRMTKFYQCLADVKTHLNSFRQLVLDLLTGVFDYQKKTNMSAHNSFLSMLLSVHLYLHNDSSYRLPDRGDRTGYRRPSEAVNAIASVTHRLYNKCEEHGRRGQSKSTAVDSVIDKLVRTHTYIINQVETSAIECCHPFVFDATEFRTSLWVSSIGSVRKSYLSKVNHMGKIMVAYADREMDFLRRLNIVDPDNNRVSSLNLQTMMLYSLLDIELVGGRESSALRFMEVPWNTVTIPLERVYEYVLTDYHSDQIIKYQVLVMETIVSTVLYLVANILDRSGTDNGQDDPALRAIVTALDSLEGFGFPGHIAMALGQMKRTLQTPSFAKHVLYSTGKYFSSVTVDDKCISGLIRETTELGPQRLTDILVAFTESIDKIRPDIEALNETNKYLYDYEYEYENIGFLHAKPNERHLSNRNVAYIAFSCDGASVLIKHLIVGNYLLDQCRALGSSRNNSNVNMCLAEVKRFIGGYIGKAVMLFLEATIDFYTTAPLIIPCNRKLIESIYAFVLYINNETFVVEPVDSLHDRVDGMQRSHLYIINVMKQFTVDYCSGSAGSKQLVVHKKACEVQIHGACDRSAVDGGSGMKTVKCVGKIMAENARKMSAAISNLYDSVRFERRSKDKYTFELLLLDVVIKKSSVPDNGFSLLTEIRTMWQGQSRSLIEIRDTVKRRSEPKYLLRYQLLMTRMVAFIAYERMKDVVVEIKSTDTKAVGENFRFLMKRSVNASVPSFPDSINNLFSVIFGLFNDFLKDVSGYENGDKVIEAIEFEQRKLELYTVASDGPSAERPSDDDRLDVDHKLAEPGTVANQSVEPENIPPKSKINETVLNAINRFVKYLADVLEVKTELNHVINIIDWKRLRDNSVF